jgi:hypothetical protein
MPVRKALYPCLPATVYRPEQVAMWSPHVARGSIVTEQNESALRQIIGPRGLVTPPPHGKVK